MTRHCSQCSANHRGKCAFVAYLAECDDVTWCDAPIDGWSIDWVGSGFCWDKCDDEGNVRDAGERDTWYLRTEFGVAEGYIEWAENSCDPQLWRAWDICDAEGLIFEGSIKDCARALVEKVREG